MDYHMSVVPALERLEQEYCFEFVATLDYYWTM